MANVKRLMVFVAIFLLVSTQKAFPEEQFNTVAPDTEVQLLNGRYWKNLPNIGKTMFIRGILDGIYFTTRFVNQDNKSKFVNDVVCSLKVGEISALIDELYKDKYNANLPIIVAYSIIVYKANGATPEEFEKNLSSQRKYWK